MHSLRTLCTGSAKRKELIAKAEAAITKDLMSTTWREQHPDVVYWQPYPFQREYDPDIPEPEPLPQRDWNEFELRAFVEKKRLRATRDAAWHKRQQDIGRYTLANTWMTPLQTTKEISIPCWQI